MWTDDQLKAIEAPVSDILVTAAAGSGKTAVMVERLIERVIAPDGVDIDRILVVTFTKAAASEIKERVAAKIAEKLEQSDSKRLKNQLFLINSASICTIHSFCLDMLKNNFHLLNLDPNFKVGDTTELSILKAKAMGDVLDEHYDEEDEVFLRVINSFTQKRDDAIEKIIDAIYAFAQSTPDPDKFLDDCCNVYSGDCEKQLSYILEGVFEDAEYAEKCYNRAVRFFPDDVAYEKVLNVIKSELDLAKTIKKLCKEGWDKVYDYIKDYKFAVIRSNKNMDLTVFEEIKRLRENARNCLKTIIQDKINLPLSTITDDLLYMRPCVIKLCQLVKEFSAVFSEYKNERNIVDFNDIEHLALKLLTNPEYEEVAKAQKERFEEIYIDEYQDCNGVQEALFKAVSRDADGAPNMFMVGDMKQCIYRFRNANPQLFKEKSDTYAPYGSGGSYNKIVLSKNFRSRAEVLDCVNLIFSRIMSESVGELDYTEEEYLYNGASYEDVNEDMHYVDLCIIDTSDDTGEDDIGEKPAVVAAEAELVARKIRSLVDGGYTVYDKSLDKYRPLKYRDIAILLRKVRGGNGDYFVDALSQHGIGAFCDTGAGYFDCEEVGTLISFIKIISNPFDDINLVSVMRSPVYNFTDNELLKIRTADRTGYFYDAVIKYTVCTDALAAKVKAFLNKVENYRRKSSVMAVDEFLWYLLSDTGYMEFTGTLSGATYKKANIRSFINCAHIFSANNGNDISAFANYVDEISMSGGDGKGAKLIGENDDVVRIMTVHKSKGLEFPVVFVCQCGNKFNLRDLSAPVIMHHELGLGINYVDEKKRFSYKMAIKNAVRDKILEENLSEEMRLLYVALTRAREKLFITGAVDDYYNKFITDIRNECADAGGEIHSKSVSSARTYLKWICQAVYEDDNPKCIKLPGGGFVRTEVVPIYTLASSAPAEHSEYKQIAEKDEHSPYKGEILRRITYQYPYGNSTQLPRNVTVTEIKRISDMADEDTYRLYRMPELKKPAFSKEASSVSAAAIGTLMHLCMEKIELTEDIKDDTIKIQIRNFVNAGFITEEEAAFINAEVIAEFFRSDVGRAMVKSKTVCREVPFEILVEADEIFAGATTSEKIVVQGMIDAYFTDEDGNVILVDYKTDRRKGVSADEFRQQIARRYALQINYYEKALQMLTGRSVHKKYIYLFDTGEAVEMR
ncbi:MAG: helicase-exonuclease AddAB subunit AddA [Clostridia bacterium]|nr:helicase-exonuclease AddAB subunit AddA [Clostridia bacterium]